MHDSYLLKIHRHAKKKAYHTSQSTVDIIKSTMNIFAITALTTLSAGCQLIQNVLNTVPECERMVRYCMHTLASWHFNVMCVCESNAMKAISSVLETSIATHCQPLAKNDTICTTLNTWMTEEIDNMLSEHGFDDTESNTIEPTTQTSKDNIHEKLT